MLFFLFCFVLFLFLAQRTAMYMTSPVTSPLKNNHEDTKKAVGSVLEPIDIDRK
jgi:hypothetical protein